MHGLAKLHRAMKSPELKEEFGLRAAGLLEEYEKRNRQLRKVRRFLRDKGQKTPFEIYLQQNFDPFLEEAVPVSYTHLHRSSRP